MSLYGIARCRAAGTSRNEPLPQRGSCVGGKCRIRAVSPAWFRPSRQGRASDSGKGTGMKALRVLKAVLLAVAAVLMVWYVFVR